MVSWVNKPVKDILSCKQLYFEPMANGIHLHILKKTNKTIKKQHLRTGMKQKTENRSIVSVLNLQVFLRLTANF